MSNQITPQYYELHSLMYSISYKIFLYLPLVKNKKTNIIKVFTTSKAIQRYLVVLFMLHFLLAHAAFENYVICIENDGRFSLENTVESESCCKSFVNGQDGNRGIELETGGECQFCTDFSIYENCDEYYSHQVKRFHPFILISPVINFETIEIRGVTEAPFAINSSPDMLSPQSESNKTVVLLI